MSACAAVRPIFNTTGGLCSACCPSVNCPPVALPTAVATARTLPVNVLLAAVVLVGGTLSPPYSPVRTSYTLLTQSPTAPASISLTSSGSAPVLAECWDAARAVDPGWVPTSLKVVPLPQPDQHLVMLPPVAHPMVCELFLATYTSRLTILALPPASGPTAAPRTTTCQPPDECVDLPASAAGNGSVAGPTAGLAYPYGDPYGTTMNGTQPVAVIGPRATAPPDDGGASGAGLLLGCAGIASSGVLFLRWNRYHRAWSRQRLMSGMGLGRSSIEADPERRDMAYTAI